MASLLEASGNRRAQLARQSSETSLDATSLVNEAYLRLIQETGVDLSHPRMARPEQLFSHRQRLSVELSRTLELAPSLQRAGQVAEASGIARARPRR